ncbi:unnamed protein product [Sphagnum jensenii]|uniref:Glycerol-3-phosphate acyltransferase RAM2/GPAT1-8 HAD-like domain-containing protein n=1 Tax=Sphagnum jensenii TaxID=128206 RepID=A0ABP1ACX5_9BRYO
MLTAAPRIMVECFAREFLDVYAVIGTEIQVTKSGRATGFVKAPGLLQRIVKLDALKAAWKGENAPDVGLGVCNDDYAFLALCRILSFPTFSEGYIVPANTTEMEPPLRKEKLAKTIVFYDGRLVQRPTPFLALVTLLWMPVGFILAVLRIAAGAFPMSWGYFSSLRLASEW